MVVTITPIVGAGNCEERLPASADGKEKFRSAGWLGRAPFDKLPSTSSGQAVRSAGGTESDGWEAGLCMHENVEEKRVPENAEEYENKGFDWWREPEIERER